VESLLIAVDTAGYYAYNAAPFFEGRLAS
jgi:hypothetical protein